MILTEDTAMNRDDLERVRQWADEKLTTEGEPPWSWYRYMQLKDAIGALIQGMDVTQPMEVSPQSAARSGASLRLVASVRQLEKVQSHPDRPREIQLPT